MSQDSTMKLVRIMWAAGLKKTDEERTIKGLKDPEYFARLEAVVEGIKAHLKRHELFKEITTAVKHGETTVNVTIDIPNMVVVRDPEDPSHAFFHIPAKEA